jgi:hypothetical protein
MPKAVVKSADVFAAAALSQRKAIKLVTRDGSHELRVRP